MKAYPMTIMFFTGACFAICLMRLAEYGDMVLTARHEERTNARVPLVTNIIDCAGSTTGDVSKAALPPGYYLERRGDEYKSRDSNGNHVPFSIGSHEYAVAAAWQLYNIELDVHTSVWERVTE